tara:strand:+ start:7049 stop:7369 length:321 start_codon:yes stop_codon:yes gene_type:complete
MTFSSLKLESLKLSSRALELLEWVVEEYQLSSDPRGFYCEFEPQGYKPWKPQEVAELLHHELVTVHEESDSLPSWEECQSPFLEEELEYEGVAFLKANFEKLKSYQ